MKIAIYNHKGGVGKSTIAVQLAHGLSKDSKVLLIDLDSRNDCSLFLGMEGEYEKTFFDLMDYRHPAPLKECIYQARKNLDLLPNKDYSTIIRDFHREPRLDDVMQEKLWELEGYDYVIFDCSPSQNVINTAILYYVDYIIIPVQLERASIIGVNDIVSYLFNLKVQPDKKVKMIIPNMYDKRTTESRSNLVELRRMYQESGLLTEPIHRRTRITEATARGKTIFEYDKFTARQFKSIIERVKNFG